MKEPKYIPTWEVPVKCRECHYWIRVKCVAEECVGNKKTGKCVAGRCKYKKS